MVLNEDPEMAKLYQEVYGDFKADREREYDQISRVHERFDYLYEKGTLDNKVPTQKFNPTIEQPEVEEELWTTELSDQALDLIYKRYKLMTTDVKRTIEDIDEEALWMQDRFKLGLTINDKGFRTKSVEVLKNEINNLYEKKAKRMEFSDKLESYVAQIKIMHDLNNLKPE